MGVASLPGAPRFSPGGVLSRQHGQDTRVVAAGWLGLCSRNCQTLDRDGFLPPRAGWGAPWGFTALEPPADERDLGWMFFIFYFWRASQGTRCQPGPGGPGLSRLEEKRTKENQVLIEFDFH